MNGDRLLRTLDGLAAFYAAYPEEEAVAGMAAHIRSFWNPRMRAAIAARLRGEAPGLSPLARAALAAAIEVDTPSQDGPA